jgi:NADPH:quinone reductase-like Zn-dependent oxidoreductase
VSARPVDVVEVCRHGRPSVLRLRRVEGRDPGPGEVRIAVRAAGVNFADVLARMGLYGPAPPPPFVPGFEVSGVVAAVGQGVDDLGPGDQVMAATRFGGYASALTLERERVLALPSGWSFAEGAGFLATYATAWHALVTLGRVGPGSRVLVHAGAGGLGTASIQLARHLGARVVATASGDKAAFCERQGAHRGIDYRRADWPAEARRASDGSGFDVVLDSVLGPTLKPSLRLLRPSGHLVLVGAASFTPRARRNWLVLGWKWLRRPLLDPLRLIPSNRTVSGFNLLLLWQERDYMARLGAALVDLAATGAVRPVLDRSFPLAEAGAAHEHLQRRLSRGKVVLTVPA